MSIKVGKAGSGPMKVAVAACAALSVKLQVGFVPLLEQSPVQPLNVVAAGVSVSVTEVAGAKLATHVTGHEIPAGDDVTVPLPETVTVSG